MSQFSKILTVAPLLWGMLFLTIDFLTEFVITESQIMLIEFMIGSTVIGGTANAGFKRYVKYKNKQQI